MSGNGFGDTARGDGKSEILDGAFELRMSEQELNSPKITSLSIDLRRLRPAH
jgi:hypothetical protein